MTTLKDLEVLEAAKLRAEREYALARDTFILQHCPWKADWKTGDVIPFKDVHRGVQIERQMRISSVALLHNEGRWEWRLGGHLVRKSNGTDAYQQKMIYLPVAEREAAEACT